ncbi:hypothetical protein [Nocardiopsis listeri]|uniref:hypothetical protein n=1 Tax=Nocardiopsis listeri TaxID=53440 RepID=UPI0009FCA781|nr:hypothetical protein [Nocardiopsis listeri]
MVEESETLRHARPRGPRSGWFPLGIAVAAIAILVGGWAAVNTVLPDTTPVESGHSMVIATGSGHQAKLSFDDGWELHPGSSSAGQQYQFSNGPVRLRVTVVTPPERSSETALWEGMREVVRVGDSSASLTDPRPVTAESGAQGLTGTLHSNEGIGTAALFPSPNGGFAVESLAVGEDSGGDLADADKLLQSIRFDRTEGGA